MSLPCSLSIFPMHLIIIKAMNYAEQSMYKAVFFYCLIIGKLMHGVQKGTTWYNKESGTKMDKKESLLD